MNKLVVMFIAAVTVTSFVAVDAFAAKPTGPTERVGYDVSYPQCGKRLPTDQYFGIVGVNGGKATTTNPCLSTQLAWANTSKTGSNQPKVQLYVNTANPGEVIDQITTWPTSNADPAGALTTNPYGDCTGSNDAACSWQYGWNRAVEDFRDRFTPAAQTAGVASDSSYTWWLDVETGNTWQASQLSNNTATLEGMTAYFTSIGGTVGLYSTAQQWGTIVGTTVSGTSNLNKLPNWRPGAASLNTAVSNCQVAPLTVGGTISLTQYVVKNIDTNHSCI